MNSVVDETIKQITESNIRDEFLVFIDKYKQDYNLIKLSNYKYENNKLHREALAGWFEEPLRPMRIIGNYKIYAERFMCVMSYTRYYIADTTTGYVYTLESSHNYGWNGTLEKLVKDLTLVMQGEYKQSLIPREITWDVSAGI